MTQDDDPRPEICDKVKVLWYTLFGHYLNEWFCHMETVITFNINRYPRLCWHNYLLLTSVFFSVRQLNYGALVSFTKSPIIFEGKLQFPFCFQQMKAKRFCFNLSLSHFNWPCLKREFFDVTKRIVKNVDNSW